jgi:hypothetical protein
MFAGPVRAPVQVEQTAASSVRDARAVYAKPFRTAARPSSRSAWRLVHALLHHHFHLMLQTQGETQCRERSDSDEPRYARPLSMYLRRQST